MIKTAQIREQFLQFFEKEHNSTRVQSSSLIPDNPTILLTTAGMVQFVPYFLGLEKFPNTPARATTCQKCARAGGKDSDIENVGRTPRHHTFFEMLGNFSFGDYFKEEIIPWSWDFVTNYLKLDKNKLWITIFEQDDEAGLIWEKTGVDKSRILKKGKKDNFWGPPGAEGPCGPCSEIHYDLGEHLKCSDDCSVDTCECDRWVEIWNLVFMELFQDEKGNLTPLEKKNVDTGMGLERIAMVCQGVESTFETDLLKQIIDEITKLSGVKYKQSAKTDVSLRIICDHARAVSFLISDGVNPSNEGRGYVLRMILRRALRHGHLLGLELPFMEPIVDRVLELYGDSYPELIENAGKIQDVILKEEEKFALTLKRGFSHIEDLISKLDGKVISGEEAFKLYDTYGFPFELTKEIAEENNIEVDEDGFKKAMAEQKERARSSTQKVSVAGDLAYINNPKTDFRGYDDTELEANVLDVIHNDDSYDVILDKTVFYAQGGGQVGDIGKLLVNNREIEVIDTFKVQDIFIHRVKESVDRGDSVKAIIDFTTRKEVERHHTLAHLLQAALIKNLGNEVAQAGSQVESNRARFDFSFPRALTKQEIEKVEKTINQWINKGIAGQCNVMSVDEAQNSGAIALFGEKYGDNVRVVSFFDEDTISKELCGGTHVSNTLELRMAKIVSENAISSGVRRIEALCSNAAFDYLSEKAKAIDEIAQDFKVPFNEVAQRIEKLNNDNKELSNKVGVLNAKMASSSFDSFLSKAQDITGGKLFISRVEEFEPNTLRNAVETFSKKLGDSIIVLVSVKSDDSSTIIAKVSDNFIKTGIQAGKIVGEISRALGGGGGGKPQMAQGAGKNTTDLDSTLSKIENDIKTIVS